jgi:glycopeptide antibiotics resistance protein
MKDKVILASGIISYVLSFLFIVLYLFMEFSVFSVTSPIERLKVLLFVFILMYLGCFLLYKEKRCKKFKLGKFNLWILFILYLIMLFNMTLFDSYFGRIKGSNYLLDASNIYDRFMNSANLIPFRTIRNFIIAVSNGNLSLYVFIYNIFGNLLAFMPLALFLPKLIPFVDKWYKYFLVVSLFIILIEIMQFVLDVGSLDIDDYILNIVGSMLCYIVFNIKKINKFINKFLFLED